MKVASIDSQIRVLKIMRFCISLLWISGAGFNGGCAVLSTFYFWRDGETITAIAALVCFGTFGFCVHQFRENLQWCREVMARLSRLRAEKEIEVR